MGVSSFSSFSGFDGADAAAFLVCGIAGYFIGSFAPAGAPAIYTTVLVSYHLFLAWLIFGKRSSGGADGMKQSGVSLPIGHTILTHAACLAVIIAFTVGAVHAVAFFKAPPEMQPGTSFDPQAASNEVNTNLRAFKVLVCALAGLAFFERNWLFSSEAPEKPRAEPVIAAPPTTIRATTEDAAEWQRYLAANASSFRPGTSIKDEYAKWLEARYRNSA